MFSTFKKE